MFSMCSELTPRAHIPDTRIPQLMQPCERSIFHVFHVFLCGAIITCFVANLEKDREYALLGGFTTFSQLTLCSSIRDGRRVTTQHFFIQTYENTHLPQKTRVQGRPSPVPRDALCACPPSSQQIYTFCTFTYMRLRFMYICNFVYTLCIHLHTYKHT